MKKKIAFFLIIILGLLVYIKINSTYKEEDSKLSGFEKIKIIFNSGIRPEAPLAKTIKDALIGTTGTYAVAVKNLKTGESYFLNENRQFKTGSLYKLWVMATVFDQIEKGNLKTDEILSGDVENLNKKFNIPEDSVELKEGIVTLRVSDALTQMVTISHNYAAFLLIERIKLSTVGDYIKNKGFTQSVIGANLPTSTAGDIELFLEKLYKGELADKDSTEKMLDLLKKQKLNNKLPKDLPSGIIIAHKTGELDEFTHDAGIVYTPQSDYIIVVLTQSDMPDAAENRIIDISKNVFNYFSK